MTLLNKGYIVVPKKYVRELLFFLDAAGIDGEEYPKSDESVVGVAIEAQYGDIKNALLNIVTRFTKKGVLLNGEITVTCAGNYDGKFVITNGEFNALDQEEAVLRDVSMETLYNELRRRGATNNAEKLRCMTTEELAERFDTVTKDILAGNIQDRRQWRDWLQSEITGVGETR